MSDQFTAEQETAQEVAATAAAKAHAAERGVDLSKIGGTGKNGAVTKADIEAAIAARPELLTGGAAADVGKTESGEPEVEATVGHDIASGKYLVSIITRHPDPTVVAVNGKAVWEGVS
jgi:pyruvate/2-oxoglutarate dehydrogenase complex dihydrolipoamide acyltransferase (E2) component